MGEGCRVVQGSLVVSWRGSGRSQTRGGAGGPPSKSSGLHRLLVVLEGEPSEQTLAQPSPAWGGPARAGSQGAPIFPTRFPCSSRTWSAPGSHRAEGLCGQNPGLQVQQGLGPQVLRQAHGGFHGVPSATPLILGRPLHVLEANAATALALHLQRDPGLPRASLRPARGRSGPRTPETLRCSGGRSPGRGRGRRPADAG
ncbi:hypothetical protein HJG60_009232 [Phyllostomus discolor]|uniref:Uncharacterized protein n=1 Tax=Phyllostomus discolor TaxID=89673 RepID=A0A833YS78_9CHIR|nr:hypothetical protein HJG60_009232 [Phyllostomus discolor]